MDIHKIEIYREVNAPAEKVWRDFNDHAGFGKMMGIPAERIADSPDPGNINGVGSVRVIKIPLFPFEETIRRSEMPDSIEYQITKGSPLDHHYGRIQFKPLPGGGTGIDYTIELGSKIPLLGIIIKMALQKGLENGLDKYVKRSGK